MSNFVSSLLTSYLLMPILAFIMGIVAYFLAKKNKMLTNKKFIFYVLLGGVILALPALLGFVHYWFMPYIYLSLQIFYVILGYYNVKIIRKLIPQDLKYPFVAVMSVQFLMMFIGVAFFAMIFNFCNELKYGLWACTCVIPFLLPPLIWETYNKYMSIPPEVFKSWKYTQEYDLSFFEKMDYDKLLVMEIEIFKSITDSIPAKIKAKAPGNMSFGAWFYKFLTDYNIKFPAAGIELTSDKEVYQWIFYIKRSFFLPRKHIDHELSIEENKIREQDTIVAKRVNKTGIEESTDTLNS